MLFFLVGFFLCWNLIPSYISFYYTFTSDAENPYNIRKNCAFYWFRLWIRLILNNSYGFLLGIWMKPGILGECGQSSSSAWFGLASLSQSWVTSSSASCLLSVGWNINHLSKITTIEINRVKIVMKLISLILYLLII